MEKSLGVGKPFFAYATKNFLVKLHTIRYGFLTDAAGAIVYNGALIVYYKIQLMFAVCEISP